MHRSLVLACHVTLIALLAAATLMDGATMVNVVAAALVVSPLLLMLWTLAVGRGAERWLAVLLVPYAGGLCVEVIARAGAARLLDAGLIVVVLELGLVLAVIRRPRPRAAPE